MKVTLMVDGSFCPDTGAGGFGYWIAAERGREGGGGPINKRCRSSLEVEMKAVCNSLVVGMNKGLIQPCDAVLIQTDCKWGISSFLGNRPVAEDGEAEAVSFFKSYVEKHVLFIEFRHVKGHSTSGLARFRANNHCDERAKKAMRIMRRKFREETRSEYVQAYTGAECGDTEGREVPDLRTPLLPWTTVREGRL